MGLNYKYLHQKFTYPKVIYLAMFVIGLQALFDLNEVFKGNHDIYLGFFLIRALIIILLIFKSLIGLLLFNVTFFFQLCIEVVYVFIYTFDLRSDGIINLLIALLKTAIITSLMFYTNQHEKFFV